MIQKAVIMSLALLSGISALSELNEENVNVEVTADDVAIVVWDYLSQLNSDANGTVEQKAELTQKLKKLFQENILGIFHDKSFPDEMEKELVPFSINLYQCLTKDLEEKKVNIHNELKDLQLEMASHIQEVKQNIGDNARLLLEHLEPFLNMLKGSVSRITFLNAQLIKSIKDLENALSDNVDSLQALLPSKANQIKENIAMNLLKFQAILMALKHEVKKTINLSMKGLSSSLAPFVKDQQKLDHQLEGLSFQLKKETLKLVANLSVKTYELWKLLEPLPEAILRVNKDEPNKSLANLKRLMDNHLKIFQCKASSNIDTLEKVMKQKLEEFGQKLGPHAGYMDDHMIFLEKELKDKVRSFFNNLKNKAENVPNPAEPCTEPCPLEQNSANLG